MPVARDAAGRLVVDDLPSFAAAPARAARELPDDEPLTGADRGAIEDVLTRFLRAYLAGDTGGLAYLVRAGGADRRGERALRAAVADLGAELRRRRLAGGGRCW